MFFVKTRLGISPTHGIGVFAGERIEKGAAVYRHSPELDLMLSEEHFLNLDPKEQALVLHYGYRDKRSGLYRLDHDDIRFVNDSNHPNIGLDEESGNLVALCAIEEGEEILQNYYDFEDRRFASDMTSKEDTYESTAQCSR